METHLRSMNRMALKHRFYKNRLAFGREPSKQVVPCGYGIFSREAINARRIPFQNPTKAAIMTARVYRKPGDGLFFSFGVEPPPCVPFPRKSDRRASAVHQKSALASFSRPTRLIRQHFFRHSQGGGAWGSSAEFFEIRPDRALAHGRQPALHRQSGAGHHYGFTVRNRTGTYRHHAHPRGFSAPQTFAGLSNFFMEK